MRIIGSIVLDRDQAKALESKTSFTVPRDAWRDHVHRRVKPGDLFWVREPFVEFEDKKRPWQNDIGYGDPATVERPEWFKKHSPHKVRYRTADKMVRVQSRFTLEVVAITDERGLHCWLYREQINRHMTRVAA